VSHFIAAEEEPGEDSSTRLMSADAKFGVPGSGWEERMLGEKRR
jgi:hypothetical protein